MGQETVQSNPLDAVLTKRLQKLPDAVNKDENLIHRGRFLTVDFIIGIGARSCFVSIVQGKIQQIEFSPQRMRSSAFSIRASAEAWQKFWMLMPEPWSHDLFAMCKKGYATIEGNLHPFMANLQYFKDIMALPRQIQE